MTFCWRSSTGGCWPSKISVYILSHLILSVSGQLALYELDINQEAGKGIFVTYHQVRREEGGLELNILLGLWLRPHHLLGRVQWHDREGEVASGIDFLHLLSKVSYLDISWSNKFCIFCFYRFQIFYTRKKFILK